MNKRNRFLKTSLLIFFIVVIAVIISCNAEAQVNLITYEANGATSGTVPTQQLKLPEQPLIIQTNSGKLAKTNYQFDGWNTEADGTGIDYKEGDIYTDSKSITLYAQWRLITYTITYDGNSFTSGSVPNKQTYKPGADITILDNSGKLERTGYTFEGWNTKADGSGETYEPGVTYSNTKSFTLYAKWKAKTYTVTLDYNGGYKGSSEKTTTSQTYDSTIIIPTELPIKFGHTLAGWNTSKNGVGHQYNKGDTFKETENLTLYAQWRLSTYTITYDGNCSTSGSVPEKQIKTHGIPIELNNNRGNLERTGYTFTGWNTQYNGSGSNFDVGSTYYTNQDLTLFAQWRVSTYTIIYDGNSPTEGIAPEAQTKTHAIAITLAENSGNLRKTDYVFAGWNTKSDGSGTTYDAGTTFSVNKNTTLYAKWLPKICTITYDSNLATSGTVPTSQQAERNTKVMIKGNTGSLIKEGYIFNGWNTAPDGTGDTYNSSMYYKISTNLTLYAKWTENQYTITYDANSATEGSVPSPQIKSHGIDILLSLNTGALERADYYLEGWNTKSDGSGITYILGESYSGNEDIILYAKWHSNTYTLTYNGNGAEKGTVPNPRKVTPSMMTTIDNNYGNLKKKAFIFCGWNTATDGSGTTYYPFEEFAPKQDLLLYANWQAEKAITRDIITDANFTPFGEFIWSDESYNTIGIEAFKDDSRLVSIKIPNFICHLGQSAFLDCKNLESVEIPNSITYIANSAFKNCTSLTKVILSDNVSEIGGSSFSGCSALKTIKLPKNFQIIGDWSFADCTQLEGITFPEGLTYLGNSAFMGCTNLKNLYIPKTTKTILPLFFLDCPSLLSVEIDKDNKNFYSENNVIYNIANKALQSAQLVSGDFTVPSTVEKVSDSAFYRSKVENVVVSEGVQKIFNYAFKECSNLKTITLPTTINHLGAHLFVNSPNLTNIYYNGTEEQWNTTYQSEALAQTSATVSFLK